MVDAETAQITRDLGGDLCPTRIFITKESQCKRLLIECSRRIQAGHSYLSRFRSHFSYLSIYADCLTCASVPLEERSCWNRLKSGAMQAEFILLLRTNEPWIKFCVIPHISSLQCDVMMIFGTYIVLLLNCKNCSRSSKIRAPPKIENDIVAIWKHEDVREPAK